MFCVMSFISVAQFWNSIKTIIYVMGPLQTQSTGQNSQLTLKAVFWLSWLSRKIRQTYSLSLPLDWSQVTHFLASNETGRAYKPKLSPFYNQKTVWKHTSFGMALMLTNIYAHSSKLYTKHHIFSSYFKCWRILWKSVDKPMNLNCAIRIGLIPIQGLKGTFSIGNLKQNIKNRFFLKN